MKFENQRILYIVRPFAERKAISVFARRQGTPRIARHKPPHVAGSELGSIGHLENSSSIAAGAARRLGSLAQKLQ
jgi:hypothetical protein